MPRREPRDRQLELTAAAEEYRAMYGLAEFRLNALDRRAPVTVGAFAAVLVSLQSLPIHAQLLILLAIPPSLIWLMRTTVNHARSFEDALRRIEELEQSINGIVNKELLDFQSTHPSRAQEVGGRTGRESVLAVLSSILLMLLAAAYQMHVAALLPVTGLAGYNSVLLLIALYCLHERRRLSHYRYRGQT